MNIRRQPRVHELFATRAASQPDRDAVVVGDQRITYADLDRRANGLAQFLRGRGVGPDSVVMVHLERSIDTIIGLLAIWKAGAAYLPVEPTVPDGRVASFVKETDCATVLTSERDLDRFIDLPVTAVTVAAGADFPSVAPDVVVAGFDAAYLIYTSGSTGAPKGVVVEHDSLSYLCGQLVDRYGITPEDRVLQFGALSFDTSIEQITVALLGGATLVLPDHAWAPSELPDKLRHHGVTVMDLTPAYWRGFLSAIASGPGELPVRLTIVGGEAVHAEDCRTALALMPGTRLVNAYGLTETTITSCVGELTEDVLPARGAAPVGPPLPGTFVYVLDEDLRPVGENERGEVYIAGPGVARGYLAETLRGHDRFVPNPFVAESGVRMYRTGDLGRWTAEGNLEVVGRIDRQLKIRGFRVEPGEIEATLAAHDGIDTVAVTAFERNGQRQLAAYYTGANSVPVKELREFVGRHLPDYMVPTAFVTLPELPLKTNGKVDLAALPAPESTADHDDAEDAPVDLFERGVARLWRQVLKVEKVRPEDNFFELGGNSILAAELLAKVRGSLGVLITQVRPLIRLLLEDATLRSFAAAVKDARAGTLAGDDTRKRVDFVAESTLDIAIGQPKDTPNWQDPEHILLTGATGFLGIYLLRELLTTTNAVVHCLVRADDRDQAVARVAANALHYFGDDLAQYRLAGRIVGVVGDLGEPGLGLSEEDFDTLARTVDVIHHPGGRVNFIYPYSHMRQANVEGTREIIRMAARHRNIPVHYTSTMAVVAGFGTAGVRHVDETTPLAHADHLSVGYVESKWVAERLLSQAAEQGLPVAIYRAADISGDRVNGAWNTATEMCAMKKFVVDTGAAPIAELPLDYTPVDVFAAAVCHIAATSLPAGEVYHLTNPGKVNIADLVARLRAHGHEIREVSWSEWLEEMVRVAVEQPDHPMTPFAPLFIDRCATGQMSVAEMYLENTFPVFSRTNVENALRGSGIEIPPVDTAMLDRYIGYLTAIDFLRAA
jgi:amino acid adenylation domain-containing protein/thioester reductase-like protein